MTLHSSEEQSLRRRNDEMKIARGVQQSHLSAKASSSLMLAQRRPMRTLKGLPFRSVPLTTAMSSFTSLVLEPRDLIQVR
jgi:hypothetical protein